MGARPWEAASPKYADKNDLTEQRCLLRHLESFGRFHFPALTTGASAQGSSQRLGQLGVTQMSGFAFPFTRAGRLAESAMRRESAG